MDEHALRQLLQGRFLKKQAKNPKYSLRAFARYLDMSPSAVSEILRGKRNVSRKLGERIAGRINTKPEEWNQIFLVDRKDKKKKVQPIYSEFDMDTYHAVSQWYYFAILSLAELDDFDGNPKTLSLRLNISEKQAKDALKRLERLALLKRNKKGYLTWTESNFKTSEDIKNISAQRSLREGLDLARQALDHQSIEEREFSAITMAIDPSRIPDAKRMIRKFRDQLSDFLEGGNRQRIYRLGIQLFSLSDNGRSFDEE